MQKIKGILIKSFHFVNLTLIIIYLFPGSIFGYFLYNNTSIQPQITKDFSFFNFLISSNHFYVFFVLSVIGVLAYYNTNKIKILIKYLFLLSIILELSHIFIPNRGFEFSDLFGNFMGVVVVVIIYKIKKNNEKNN